MTVSHLYGIAIKTNFKNLQQEIFPSSIRLEIKEK